MRKLAVLHCSVLTVFYLLLRALSTDTVASSAVLGSLVCLIPTWYQALRVLGKREGLTAKAAVHRFYTTEAIKFAMTALLFALIFKWFTVSAVAVFCAFIFSQCALWTVPLLLGLAPYDQRS